MKFPVFTIGGGRGNLSAIGSARILPAVGNRHWHFLHVTGEEGVGADEF